MLWQFMGLLTPDTDIEQLTAFSQTAFGLTNAELSAFGVLEGPETDIFRRMATRAGSLLSDSLVYSISGLIGDNFADSDWVGKPLYVCNTDRLAAWLNLMLISVTSFQPSRFKNGSLLIDPFAASLAVFDHIINRRGFDRDHSSPPFGHQKFRVALSFPGEKRVLVEEVANHLSTRLSPVFYDRFFEAELAQPNLDVILQRVYHDNAELIVVFICAGYDQKEWCGLEWRAMRDLIKKKRGADIMLLRFDDTEIDGLYTIDGYIDISNRSAIDIANLICRRYEGQKTG